MRGTYGQRQTSSTGNSPWLTLAANATLFWLFSSLPAPAYGAPLVKRDDGTVRTVVPIVVIISVAAVIVITVCARNGLHKRLWRGISHAATNFGPSTGTTTSNANGTRELTAQQLVASTGQNGQTTETTAAQPARRARRNRRTPSQISTRSLPMYMKEPGEQEVVIYRGPEDMEDMPITANVAMPAVLEAPDASSVDLTESRVYVPMPDSPHDMPLLAGDESLATSQADVTNDNSHSNLLPTHRSRPSSSTLASSLEGPTLEDRLATPESDPRGEAPAYFEVVPLRELDSADSSATPALTSGAQDSLLSHPDNTTDDATRDTQGTVRHHAAGRLSGFLSIFHGRSASAGTPAHAPSASPEASTSTPGHRREDSDTSLETANTHLTRSRRAPSRSTMHRPSFSGSNSMFSVMTRSRSRLVDHNQAANLTSPSMISLNSISAPLSHTLVRTEFTYPKTGPTPEQVKLISSREAFQRFGVPYGEDAIAYAASTSRVELPGVPPPEFEEITRTESRIESPLARNAPETVQEEETSAPEVQASGSGSGARDEDQSGSQPQPSETTAASSQPTEQHTEGTGKQPEVPAASASNSGSTSSPAHPPGLKTSSPAPEASQPSSSTLAVPTETSLSTAPSAFPARSESRASSAISFATAEESIHATPLSSPPSTPFASVSSRMTVPKVPVSTSPDVDDHSDSDNGDEEEDAGAATPPPHESNTPTTPTAPHKSLSHDREDTTTTLMPTTTASISPETVVPVPPVVVAH